MSRLRGVLARFLNSVAARDGDLHEELAHHLALHEQDHIRAGLPPDEARRRAMLQLGGAAQTVDRYRDQLRLPVLDALRQDLGYGLRALRRSPGFTATAMLTLAIGVGANAAIFSVVNAVLLRPLPFRDPDRLVMMFGWLTGPRGGDFDVVSYPDYADWADQNRAFEATAAFANRSATLTIGGQARRVRAMRVTPGIFDVLGIKPALGHAFNVEEQNGAMRVVILSDEFWRRWFDRSAAALGQKLRLDDEPYEIVGVMPPEFRVEPVASEQLYLPQPIDASRGHAFLRVVGRLKPGRDVMAAQVDMDTIAARLARVYPATNQDLGVHVVAMSAALSRDVRFGLWLMLGAATMVLLIACTNVAGLALARAASRQREFAVRAALGANRGRLARQLLTESMMLAIAGGAAGLAAAGWTSQLLAAVLAQQFHVPRVETTHIDLTVVLFTTVVSMLSGAASGALPMFMATAPRLPFALRDGERSATGFRAPKIRSVLVVVEIGLALVLLAGAGTLLKTFLMLRSIEPGFETSHLLVVDLWQPPARFETIAARAQFYGSTLSSVRSIPGVRAAGFVANLPLLSGFDSMSFRVVGGAQSTARPPSSAFNIASTGYFSTMRIPVRSGREFSDADGPSTAPVAIVNETAARRFWLGESPLGRQIGVAEEGKSETLVTVVGVVGDVRHVAIDRPAGPEIYLNSMQTNLQWPGMVLAVGADNGRRDVAAAVESALKTASASAPIENISSMESIVARSIAAPRVYTFLLGAFATIAIALAAVGVFGLVSYGVSQRAREIGVRMALGAARRQIVMLVVSQGLVLAGCGALIGAVASLAATRLLVDLVPGVEPNHPPTLIAMTLVLLAVAVMASYIPARRAARVDPSLALRSE